MVVVLLMGGGGAGVSGHVTALRRWPCSSIDLSKRWQPLVASVLAVYSSGCRREPAGTWSGHVTSPPGYRLPNERVWS